MRRSGRARRPRIVVHWDREVEVVVPLRAPADTVSRVLDQHRDWLARQLAKPRREFRLGLQREDVVWIQGRALPLPRRRSIERWYRERARELTVRSVTRESARLGIGHGAVTIRDQRTRWASCSARGTLSFNWRLVLAPPDVLDYVVVHELCHRMELTHSPRFWGLLAEARPGFERERRWLDEHGPELLAYKVPTGRHRPSGRTGFARASV